MQHGKKFALNWLANSIMLLACLVLMQGVGYAQSFAFSPGLTSVLAGDPNTPSPYVPSPATYVGPAAGYLPQSQLFSDVVTDKYGNVYLSEARGNIVRVVASGNGPIPVLQSVVASPQAGYVYTVAGTGVDLNGNPLPLSSSCTSSDVVGDGCPATQAVFANGNGPNIAVDANGNLYCADRFANLIRVVYAGGTIPGLTSPQPGYIYAVAGIYENSGYTGSAGLATSTPIGSPEYVAVDATGNIFFTGYDANTVPILLALSVSGSLPGFASPTNGYVYTIVGNTGTATDGIAASTSALSSAGGVAIDSAGNIYVADSGSVRVIYVGGTVPGLSSLTAGHIYSVAGGGSNTPTFFTPTLATNAQITPNTVAVDPAGDLYIEDSNNNLAVYKVDTSGNLTLFYGATTPYSCVAGVDLESDGCATDAGVQGRSNLNPTAVGVDQEGNVYVPDALLPVVHEINVLTSSLYFTPGQTQPVIIYNTATQDSTGAHNLTISNVAGSTGFSLVPVSPIPTGFTADCSMTPITLQPGESCETSIAFPSTSNTSTATGTLTVSSNSINATNGTNVIQLTGESSTLLPIVLQLESTPPNSIPAGTSEGLEFFGYCSTCDTSSPPFTGMLTLYDNGAPLVPSQTIAVTGPSNQSFDYTFNVVLPTGNNLVYAVYSGDTNFQSPQSYQALITVNGTPTTTALTATPNPAATGSTVTLTVKVSSTSGSPSDGTVTFKNGNTVIGTAPLTGGMAMLTTQPLATAGTDTFTATYAGSTTYNPSISSPVSVTVQAPVTTTTAVTASSTTPAENATVTLTATVTPASGTTAPSTGTAQFYYTPNGGGAIALGSPVAVTSGSGNTATAMLQTSQLPEGANTITAIYSGSTDKLFNGSSTTQAVTVTVGLPATTTTVTALPTSITYGGNVALTAKVIPQVGNTVVAGTVTFAAGGTTLSTLTLDNTGTAVLNTTQLPGGSNAVTDTVTATYNDPNNAFASSTGTASVSVAPLATTTNTPTSSNLNPVSGQTLTLTASVSAQGSSLVPTGTVTFYNGTTTLCSAPLSNGSANCQTSLQQGAASVTAVYVGGNGFQTSTSSSLSLTVAAPPASTATGLMASTTTASTTQPVTFTATVTNTATGGTGTPNGVVTFQSGSNVLGTGSLNASGVATFTTTFTTAGSYTVQAIYQGNSSYTGSTSSSPVTVTVTTALAMSTTSLKLSSSAVQQGNNVTFTATVAPASTSSTITPTGTVTFYNGGQQIPNSTSTLNGGIATFSIATLNAGTYSVTAQYSGDVNYNGSNSTAAALTVGAPTPSFTLNATPNNLTLTSGQSGAAIITLVPTYGYTGTVALTCGTVPANVTCSFAPATLTADGKNDVVQSTLTITTNGMTAQMRDARPSWRGGNSAVLSAALFFPAGLFALGFIGKRKRFPYLPIALFVCMAAGLLLISGCASGNGGSTNDAAKGTAQITVSAAGSAGSQSQTVNLSITIQ